MVVVVVIVVVVVVVGLGLLDCMEADSLRLRVPWVMGRGAMANWNP